MFKGTLSDNSKHKLLFVRPHGTERIQPLFRDKVLDRITCLNRYFAKQKYRVLNKEIAGALLR
jgi:hypothetical protein